MDGGYWQDAIIVRRDAVEALGDYTAAGVYDCISRRCAGGEWRVSIAGIAEATWLTPKQARRAVRILLDAGWVVVRRDDGYDRSGVYSLPEARCDSAKSI